MVWNCKYIIVLRRHADIALPFSAYSHCLYQSFFDARQELSFFCVAKKFAAFLQWTRDKQAWMAMSSFSIQTISILSSSLKPNSFTDYPQLLFVIPLKSHEYICSRAPCFTCTHAFPSCMKTDRKASTSAPTRSFGWLSIGITCSWYTN